MLHKKLQGNSKSGFWSFYVVRLRVDVRLNYSVHDGLSPMDKWPCPWSTWSFFGVRETAVGVGLELEKWSVSGTKNGWSFFDVEL